MKINQIISEVSKENFQIQRKFTQLISFNITVGIRSINSYTELTNQEKLTSINQLNELQHQIINQTRANYPKELIRIAELSKNINEQDSIAGKELGAIINLAYESYKNRSLEQLFEDRIDCNFPYNDKIESTKLISESIHYSTNAPFVIIQEIARIPFSERELVSQERLLELIAEIGKTFKHPLKSQLLDVAKLMIEQKEYPIDEAIKLMDEIRQHNGLWGALAIVYESSEDQENRLENKFNEIRDQWNGKREADL